MAGLKHHVIGGVLLSCVLVLGFSNAIAASVDFSGHWFIDLRSQEERERKAGCGNADFTLSQANHRITGSHSFATVDCGQLNEGGDGTVRGYVMESTAVLVVTSGRNGAVVLGKATRHGDKLHWVSLEEIKPGDPPTDSPLILGDAVLTLQK